MIKIFAFWNSDAKNQFGQIKLEYACANIKSAFLILSVIMDAVERWEVYVNDKKIDPEDFAPNLAELEDFEEVTAIQVYRNRYRFFGENAGGFTTYKDVIELRKEPYKNDIPTEKELMKQTETATQLKIF